MKKKSRDSFVSILEKKHPLKTLITITLFFLWFYILYDAFFSILLDQVDANIYGGIEHDN